MGFFFSRIDILLLIAKIYLHKNNTIDTGTALVMWKILPRKKFRHFFFRKISHIEKNNGGQVQTNNITIVLCTIR